MKNSILMKSTFALLAMLAVGACDGDGAIGESPQQPRGQAEEAELRYTCPMHPQFVSDDSNTPCSICGMNLVKTTKGTS